MSRSLYRKYRPQTFSDVVGQAHVVDTLRNAVNEGRLAHAYLFSGPRGTGKTTMARLLAKALLCDGLTAEGPDGTCQQCEEIAEGQHPDVYELDAASRTGVENVREEIIGRVDFAPVRGKKKVYIIDEVHMLSPAAFNALLKTLEEPPSHVAFVLCTTDPQKVPETILSRCQHFEFHRIPDTEIIAHLKFVARSEKVDLSDEASALIAARSRGGMRDALTTLEQLAVFGSGVVTDADARDLLGEIGGDLLSQIALSIADRDVVAGFEWVRELSERGNDLGHFTKEFTSFMRDIYVVSIVGDGRSLDGTHTEADLKLVAERMGSADRIARILTILSDLNTEMRRSSDQRLSLEIAFTRMARPDSDLTLESLADRIDELELAIDRMKHQVTAAPVQAAAEQAAPSQADVPVARKAVEVGEKPATASAPTTAPAEKTTARTVTASAPDPSAPAPKVEPLSADMPPSLVQRSWDQVRKTLMKEAPARGVLLQKAHAEVLKDGTLMVELPAGSSFAKTMLEKDEIRQLVSEYINKAFGQVTPWRVCMDDACGVVAEEHSAPKQEPEPVQQARPEQIPAPAPAPMPVQQAEPAQKPASAPEPEDYDLPPVDIYESDAAPVSVPAPLKRSVPEPVGEVGEPSAPETVEPEATDSEIDPALEDLLKNGFGDVIISTMETEE